MSRSYPIWNKITACIYNSNKSYGVKEVGDTEVLVGSSSSNSHTLAKVRTRKQELGCHLVRFYLKVDNVLVNEMIFTQSSDAPGRAEDLVYKARYVQGQLVVDWSEDAEVIQKYEGIYNMLSVDDIDILNRILVVPKHVLDDLSINPIYERENTLRS